MMKLSIFLAMVAAVVTALDIPLLEECVAGIAELNNVTLLWEPEIDHLTVSPSSDTTELSAGAISELDKCFDVQNFTSNFGVTSQFCDKGVTFNVFHTIAKVRRRHYDFSVVDDQDYGFTPHLDEANPYELVGYRGLGCLQDPTWTRQFGEGRTCINEGPYPTVLSARVFVLQTSAEAQLVAYKYAGCHEQDNFAIEDLIQGRSVCVNSLVDSWCAVPFGSNELCD